MVEINIWKRLSLGERIYARVRGWKDDREKIENMLLGGATKEERRIYENMKKVDIDIMRSYVKKAVKKLDSRDWRTQAYGTGEIGAFEEISCYIGYWIKDVFNKAPFHRWLYSDPKKPVLSRRQKRVWKYMDIRVRPSRFSENIYKEFDRGRENMRQTFEKIGLAFWSL